MLMPGGDDGAALSRLFVNSPASFISFPTDLHQLHVFMPTTDAPHGTVARQLTSDVGVALAVIKTALDAGSCVHKEQTLVTKT